MNKTISTQEKELLKAIISGEVRYKSKEYRNILKNHWEDYQVSKGVLK
jgi:hypothetical protein